LSFFKTVSQMWYYNSFCYSLFQFLDEFEDNAQANPTTGPTYRQGRQLLKQWVMLIYIIWIINSLSLAVLDLSNTPGNCLLWHLSLNRLNYMLEWVINFMLWDTQLLVFKNIGVSVVCMHLFIHHVAGIACALQDGAGCRYLEEIGYTDALLDVRSSRVRSLLGIHTDRGEQMKEEITQQNNRKRR